MMWTQANGQRLKFYRTLLGMTQDELALQIKACKQHLGEVERGESNPSLALLAKVCQVLQIDPVNLFVVHDARNDRADLLSQEASPVRQNRLVASSGTWFIDLSTGRAVWSRTLHRMLGLALNRKPSLKYFLTRLRVEDIPAFTAFHAKLSRGETPAPMTCTIIRKDGSARTLHIQADVRPGNAVAGKSHACAVFMDVTDGMAYHRRILERQEHLQEIIEDKTRTLVLDVAERKRVAKLLRLSEQRLASVLATQQEMICRFLPDTTLTYVNPAYCRAFGMEEQDLLGRKFLELVPANIHQEALKNLSALDLTNPTFHCIHEVIHKDGSRTWQEWTDHALFDADNNVVEFQSVGRDITAQKQAEDDLHKTGELLRTTSRMARIGGWGKNLLTGEDEWSEVTREIHEVGPDFRPDMHNSIAFYKEGPSRDAIIEAVTRLIETGEPYDVEVEFITAKGNELWIRTMGQAEFQDGRCVRIFGIIQDITEQKHMVEELRQARLRADAANRAKSEFLASMSHEVRTPINGIMGMMQLLERTALDKDQKLYVQLAADAANRLTRLLSDILDLSRVEAGKMELWESEFCLKELRASIDGLFREPAMIKKISLECVIDPALPARLVGDETRLRQVLFNLVGNALKYTENGRICVEAVHLASKKAGEVRVLFTVADTGIGIPENRLREIFEPFRQVDGPCTRQNRGAGLGLAIVKRIVGLMGGSMDMDSAPGEGTTAYVLLPFKAPESSAQTQSKVLETSGNAGPGLRILLAEDDPSNAFSLIHLLEMAGHTTVLAEDGRQAVDLFAGQDFDCILMDVKMPEMDGIEATRRIRATEDGQTVGRSDGRTVNANRTLSSEFLNREPSSTMNREPGTVNHDRRTPIIALTAHAMLGDRERFLDAGMDDYLDKPVKMEDLERVLERVRGMMNTK